MSKYINLIDKLSDLDKKRIENYIYTYGANEDNFIGLENWLQNWSHSNQKLYKLLGNKLIYSEPFEYDRPSADLNFEAKELLYNAKFKESYHRFYHDIIVPRFKAGSDERIFFNSLLDVDNLVENKVYDSIKYKKDENSNLLQISKGTKLIRACQKVINYFKNEWTFEGFEEFRLAHSMLLNNKKNKGELCFSIHPLDFMTMSDNASSWSSCMTWVEDGCYHIGTVEMMNSNCVLCCYIKSNDTDFNFSKDKEDSENWIWNNKKWRQLAYVTKDIIMSGKAYPYQNNAFSTIVITKIKELAKANLNWDYEFGPESYRDMIHLFETYSINRARDYMKYNPRKHNIIWDTRGMYNDMINDHITNYMCYRNKVKHTKIINVSGKAPCLCCGNQVIEENDYDSNLYNERYRNVGSVVCPECYNNTPYCELGDHTMGPLKKPLDITFESGTSIVSCPTCFHDSLRICDCCGKVISINYSNSNFAFYIAEKLNRITDGKNIEMTPSEHFKYYNSDSPSIYITNRISLTDEDYQKDRALLRKITFCQDCFEKARKEHKVNCILIDNYWNSPTFYFIIDSDKYPEYKKILKNPIPHDDSMKIINDYLDTKNVEGYNNVPTFIKPNYFTRLNVFYDKYSLEQRIEFFKEYPCHEVCNINYKEK